MNNARKFVELARRAERALASEADEETIYDYIFQEIAPQINETRIKFDYCDPDTSYQADSEAYVHAIRDKARNLQLILDSVADDEEA